MSAKSSNFAAESIDIMSEIQVMAQKMTHTCYRCRFSEFANRNARGLVLECHAGKQVSKDYHEATACKRWKCSEIMQSVIDGTADADCRRVVIDIMHARVKAGTF